MLSHDIYICTQATITWEHKQMNWILNRFIIIYWEAKEEVTTQMAHC